MTRQPVPATLHPTLTRRADMVWRCIWCGTTSEPLCEWSICDGHRMTLACCRELEDRPRYLLKLVGVSLDALPLLLRPTRTRRTDT